MCDSNINSFRNYINDSINCNNINDFFCLYNYNVNNYIHIEIIKRDNPNYVQIIENIDDLTIYKSIRLFIVKCNVSISNVLNLYNRLATAKRDNQCENNGLIIIGDRIDNIDIIRNFNMNLLITEYEGMYLTHDNIDI